MKSKKSIWEKQVLPGIESPKIYNENVYIGELRNWFCYLGNQLEGKREKWRESQTGQEGYAGDSWKEWEKIQEKTHFESSFSAYITSIYGLFLLFIFRLFFNL